MPVRISVTGWRARSSIQGVGAIGTGDRGLGFEHSARFRGFQLTNRQSPCCIILTEWILLMAKKSKTEKTPKAAAMAQVKIVVDISEDTPTYYANYVEATFGPHDCGLSFVRVPAKLSAERIAELKEGSLTIEASVQVTLPPTLIPSLIQALTITKDHYEAQIGPILEIGPKDPQS
jgi:hypothetical protein